MEQLSRTSSYITNSVPNGVRAVKYARGVPASELPPVPRPPSRRPPAGRRAPRERTLSREAITAAALAIVDAEGLDAMTMRRVAESLGTSAASLYAPVAGKEELLELVIDRVIGEVQVPDGGGSSSWQEELKAGLRALRAAFAAHRDIARASFARVPLGENALRGSDWMIRTLRGAGLPDQVIAYACSLLPLYVTATAYEESLYLTESISAEDIAQFVADMRTYFASLPSDRFPHVVALAGPLTAGEAGDERFEFGLEVLVRGLAAMAEPAP
jgi:AcrR family transcriptional regulator